MSCCNDTLDCLNKLGDFPHNTNVDTNIPLTGGVNYELDLKDSKGCRRIEFINPLINTNLTINKDWLNENMSYTFMLYDITNDTFIKVNDCENFQFTTFINNSVF